MGRFHGLWTDPVTGLNYARARWYDPRNAAFLTEDPLADIDSPNLYAFVGWQPNMGVDPLGLYEEDVHHYLTRYLALQAGFRPETAERIGFETQELDMDDRGAMHRGLSHENMERYHFVTAMRLKEMRKGAFSAGGDENAQMRSIGEYSHALEDTYSHQFDEERRYFGKRYRDTVGGVDIGHGLHGHEPDWTWKRPDLATKMAENVYMEMIELCKARQGSCDSRPVDEVLAEIQKFLKTKPELFDDRKYGRTVSEVISYDEKVKALDPSFEISKEEAEKRRKRYDKALKREARDEEIRRRMRRIHEEGPLF